MTLKRQHTLKTMEQPEAPRLNEVLERLFFSRVESIHKREGSSTAVLPFPFQSMEHGQVTFSANGSPTVARSFGFRERQNKIVFVEAHAVSALCDAKVTDVTATGITIELITRTGTAGLSAVTTAAITIFYQVISSNP